MATAPKKRRLETDEDADSPSQERVRAADEETDCALDSDTTVRIASRVESQTDIAGASGLSCIQKPMDKVVRNTPCDPYQLKIFPPSLITMFVWLISININALNVNPFPSQILWVSTPLLRHLSA